MAVNELGRIELLSPDSASSRPHSQKHHEPRTRIQGASQRNTPPESATPQRLDTVLFQGHDDRPVPQSAM
ncbi:hypothetical protein PMIN06_007260 [Paraphaeosphaeria minitans]